MLTTPEKQNSTPAQAFPGSSCQGGYSIGSVPAFEGCSLWRGNSATLPRWWYVYVQACASCSALRPASDHAKRKLMHCLRLFCSSSTKHVVAWNETRYIEGSISEGCGAE